MTAVAATGDAYDYDWAVLRVVPRVHLGAFENVGVVLHARRARFLGVRVCADPAAVAARWRGLDAGLLARYLEAARVVAAGAPRASPPGGPQTGGPQTGGPQAGGPIGLLPPSERFHWLVAVRSTVLQASPVHTGRAVDLAAALDGLFRAYVGGP